MCDRYEKDQYRTTVITLDGKQGQVNPSVMKQTPAGSYILSTGSWEFREDYWTEISMQQHA